MNTDELTLLKQRADDMGITYSANIGLETLRDRVNSHLTTEPKKTSETSLIEKREEVRLKAMKLHRVIITNLNPNRKKFDGEWVRGGNSIIPSVARYVKYGIETHVEDILLNILKEKKYAGVKEVKTADGEKRPAPVMFSEFQLEYLPALTQAELNKLALEQAARSNQ